MSDLSSRLGFDPPGKPRVEVGIAPPALRQFLRTHLVDTYDTVYAYRQVAKYSQVVASPDIWGIEFASPAMDQLLLDMEWDLVYEAIESEYPGRRSGSEYETTVNRVLARNGIAYEMRDGKFQPFDPEGDALGLELQNPVQGGQFATVREQFQRALDAVSGINPDARTAIREATNALEAFGRIRTGKPSASFGDVVPPLLGGTPSRKALGASLKTLYGYASQVPGARHGNHVKENITLAEARFTVRVCGAALALLLEDLERSEDHG